jgi:hypothetical protein
MPISIDINGVTSRHESAPIGVLVTMDALGIVDSTALIENETIPGGFAVVNLARTQIRNSPLSTVVITKNAIPLVYGVDFTVTNAVTSEITFTPAPLVTDSVLVTYLTDPLSYSWSLLDKPTASAMPSFSFFAATGVTFTPDVEGSYLVQLTIDDGLDSEEANTAIASVDTLKKGLSVLAAGEETEFHIDKGWQNKLEGLTLKYTTGASFKHLTIGDGVGADYDSTSGTAFADLTADLAADKFGVGVPNSATGNFYYVELLSELDEQITIPDGVILDGNFNKINGSTGVTVTLAGEASLLNAIVTNSGAFNGIVGTATGTQLPRVCNVFVDAPGFDLSFFGPVYISHVKGYPVANVNIGLSLSTALGEMAVVENCTFSTVSLNGFSAYFNNVVATSSFQIDNTTAPNSVDVDIHQCSVDGNFTILATIVSGQVDLFDLTLSGVISNLSGATLNNYTTIIPTITLNRETLTPGATLANTDIAITVPYINLSPAFSPDFLNLMVYVDGLLMAPSDDPANVTEDVIPGSVAGTIQFNFNINLATVLQIVRVT